MSLVVVNVSAGSTTTTLPLISSVPGGMITIKDSGSASSSNTITIVTTAGNTFETGTYIINTPLGYITFLGIDTRWRVIGTSYPNVPVYTSTIVPTPGTPGPANATLNTLTVSGQTSLVNTSNTGNLVVNGTTTLTSASISTLSTFGQAAFYSSVQIQGGLSVFSSITARNINFTGILTSNGTTFSGAPPGINSAGSIGINSASNASYSLLVTGNQSNTGTLNVTGATTLVNSSNTGTLGVAGTTTLTNTSNTGTLGVAGTTTLSNTSNTGTLGVAGYTTLASNITIGSGLGSTAQANTLVRLNQFVGNGNWGYLCSTDALGDVSLAANCYTSNGSWYRVNYAGAVSFVSARQGSIKFWCGAPGAISEPGNTDTSLTAIMSLTASGLTVTNTSNTGTLGVAGTTTLTNTSNTGTLGVAGATTLNTLNVTGATSLVNSSNTGTLGVAGATTLSNTSNTGTLGVAGTTTLSNTSNTGTLGVAGYTTLASNITIGSGAAGSATLIRLNMNLGNINWSYICATDGLGDVSLAVNCYTSNGSWYRVNYAGAFSFVSARQGSIKFWCGAPGAISESGNADASLSAIMSVNTSGLTVTGTLSNTGSLGVGGNITASGTLGVVGASINSNGNNTSCRILLASTDAGSSISSGNPDLLTLCHNATNQGTSNSFTPINTAGFGSAIQSAQAWIRNIILNNNGSGGYNLGMYTYLDNNGLGINTTNVSNALQVNGNAVVSGNITATRFQANGGNMTARTGGVYNRGNDAESSAYMSINWIPGDYNSGAGWNTYDTNAQAACGILCSAKTGNATIEFFAINAPSGSNAPTRVGYFNSSGMGISGNLLLSLGTVGVGVVSAQSFTTEPNVNNTINNAPTNGMGQTTGFPGLATWTASNQQPLQISGYNGINFVGGRGNWATDASHMCVVDGQVGIRNRNPQDVLDVTGNIRASGAINVNRGNNASANLNIYGSGPFNGIGTSIGVNSSGTCFINYNFANFYITNNNIGVYLNSGNTSWNSTSDERLKENITPIVNALDFCASIRTVKYSLITEHLSTPNMVGFIAQDFLNDHPEVTNNDKDGNLGLAYTETIPIVVAAIKEQKIIVDAQASTISSLQTYSLTQSSTITSLQTNAETQSSTITQVQTNAEAQSSTITGLQATIDSQASTIVAILAKYPLDI